jgi:hypothetical protein
MVRLLGWIGLGLLGAGCSAPGVTSEGGSTGALATSKAHPQTVAAGRSSSARTAGPAPSSSAPDEKNGSLPGEAGGIKHPISSIEPVSGAERLLFVSDFADAPLCLARFFDTKTGRLGPLLRLSGEHVAAAVATGDDQTLLVTSNGERLCLARYRQGAEHPDARGCEPPASSPLAPAAIAQAGDRIALLELATELVLPPATSRAATPEKTKRKQAQSTKAPAQRPKDKPKAGASKEARKKKPDKKPARSPKRATSKNDRDRASTPPAAAKIKTDVRLRWITIDGVFDAQAQPTGLSFEQPIAGMGLVAAAGRASGVDLLWYETAPPPKKPAPNASTLGRARLVAGALGPDGTFDPATRVTVVEDELDYGSLRSHFAPRMITGGGASLYMGLLGRNGPCEALRIYPARMPISPAPSVCAIDPARLLSGAAPNATEIAVLNRILGNDPRRAFGQPRSDPGLAVRAGDRVWFLKGDDLFSAALSDGTSRLEPHPFVLRRTDTGTAHESQQASPPASAPDGGVPAPPVPACPDDMVSAGGRFCIDRYEAIIVDAASDQPLSPDYPTTPNLLEIAIGEWSTGRLRSGSLHARAFPIPFVPPWQRGKTFTHKAVSHKGVRPNGYLTGLVAEAACKGAGKRLCTLDEYVTACRGEDDTAFPYGDTYVEGVCNVFRDEHPAAILHDNASIGHLDPRLNRVQARSGPLLRPTGGTLQCRSRWGKDAAYDLVGNLDEWVDEPDGAFAGGFYSRSTRAGCDAVITAHPKNYLDYSTGVRCCRDAEGS